MREQRITPATSPPGSLVGSDTSAQAMRKNSNALVLNTLLTGLSGVLFWSVAARQLAPEELARQGVLITTTLVVATVVTSNLASAITVFVPRAINARGVIARAYAGSALAASAVAIGVVVAGGRYLPLLHERGADPSVAVLLVLGVSAWCVFSLQDAALIALGRASLVPIENAAFGFLRVGCLVAFSRLGVGRALYLGWTAPTPIIIAVVNVIVLRNAARRADWPGEIVKWADHPRFIGGDLLASLASQAFGLLPLVVAWRSSATQAAYFYVSATIITQVIAVAVAIALSLMTEGSRDAPNLVALARRATWRALVLVGAVVAIILLCAPLGLRLYGIQYSYFGATSLRYLALAAFAMPVSLTFSALGRIRHRSTRALAVHGSFTLLTFILATVLPAGSDGAAIAVMLASWLVAACVAPFLWRDLEGPALRFRKPEIRGSLFPLGLVSGGPLSIGTVAVLLCGTLLPVISIAGGPTLLRIPIVLGSLLLPGALIVSVDAWDDFRWALLLGLSLALWVGVTQIFLAIGWWNTWPISLVAATAATLRFAMWARVRDSEGSARSRPASPGSGDHQYESIVEES